MGYVVQNVDNTDTYTACIQSSQKIIANEDSSSLFYNFSKLNTIEGLEYLDTSNVINMRSMFEACTNLSDLDLSHFDTSNVTDMSSMFYKCSYVVAELNSYNPNLSDYTNIFMYASTALAYGDMKRPKIT